MSWIVDFEVRYNGGLDLGFLMDAMESGLFTMDASGTERALFSMDASGTEFLPTIPNEVRLTVFGSFSNTEATISRFVFSADGVRLGVGRVDGGYTAPISNNLEIHVTATLFDSAAMTFNGGRGGDQLLGSYDGNAGFKGAGGDDAFVGNGGRDRALGGNGRDYLAGENGRDVLEGGRDHDMVRGGRGDDQIKGGTGNDVIDPGAGVNKAWGGAGRDLFVFDTDVKGKTVVMDYAAGDLILFAGVATTAGGTPDGFRFRETKGGDLRLVLDDQTVILRDTAKDEFSQTRVFFTADKVDASLSAFGTAGKTVIGESATGNELFTRQNGSETDLGSDAEGIMFETYMGEVPDFL